MSRRIVADQASWCSSILRAMAQVRSHITRATAASTPPGLVSHSRSWMTATGGGSRGPVEGELMGGHPDGRLELVVQARLARRRRAQTDRGPQTPGIELHLPPHAPPR